MLSVILLLSLCATVYGDDEAPSVTVLANHVRLYKGNNDAHIEHRYFDDDAVELICHTARYSGHVHITYDYVNEWWRDQSRDATVSWIVGLRLNLRTAHNGSRVTCTSSGEYNNRLEAKVTITFILENSVEDVINLKINGLAVRPQNTQETTNYVVGFQKLFGYWANVVYMGFECGSSNKGIVLESYQHECGNREQAFAKSTSTSRVMTDYSKFLAYVARNKTTMLPIRTIDIRFEEIPNPYIYNYPNLRVSINGAQSDDTIELYAVEGLSKTYYYYEEGESVTVKCSLIEEDDRYLSNYLYFDGEEKQSNFLTKEMKLTSEDHLREVYCKTKHLRKFKDTIRVQFRKINTTKRISNESIKVLVNRAKIYEGSNNSNIEYRYLEGDKVDVTCVGIKDICPVSMTYYYDDKHLVVKDKANMSLSADRSNPGVGLRVSLHAAHNGSYISCKCLSEEVEASAKLTFIFDNDIKDIINLKINGLILRPQNIQFSKYTVYYLRHEVIPWYRSSVLFFNYNVTTEDAVLESYRYNCSCQIPAVQRKHLNSSTTGTGLITDYDQNLLFEAHNKTSLLPLQTADIRFELIDNERTDLRPSLTLKGLQYNNTIELYSWNGDGLYYYSYEDGDNVTVECYSEHDDIFYDLSFDDEDAQDSSNSIKKNIHLTAADSNRTLDCKLLGLYTWHSDIHIRLLFRQVTKRTTTIANYTKADSAATASTPATTADRKQPALQDVPQPEDIVE